MIDTQSSTPLRWLLLGGIFWLTACATSGTPASHQALQESVEALYVNYHALETVRQELHARAQYYLLAPGDELRHIRSAALFVEQASRTAFYQWELLSITEFIRESHRRDFFTLRLSDLDRARQATRDALDYLGLYEAFVTDGEALILMGRARELIEAHLELYDRMAAILRPLANAPLPPGGAQPM
jgi:hypothetical protein